MRYGNDYYYEERYCRRDSRRNRIHRSSDGLIFGVCEGLSEWSGIPVGIMRAIALVSFICSGFFPAGLVYFLLALILPAY